MFLYLRPGKLVLLPGLGTAALAGAGGAREATPAAMLATAALLTVPVAAAAAFPAMLHSLLSLLKWVLLPDNKSTSSIASIDAIGAFPLQRNENSKGFRLKNRGDQQSMKNAAFAFCMHYSAAEIRSCLFAEFSVKFVFSPLIIFFLLLSQKIIKGLTFHE